MFVPVTCMRCVQVSVVQVVDVISVLDGDMPAIRSVLMSVVPVFDASVRGALAPVLAIAMVEMSVVDIVDVITVGNSHMSAIRTVYVWVVVIASNSHADSLTDSPVNWPPDRETGRGRRHNGRAGSIPCGRCRRHLDGFHLDRRTREASR